MQKIIGVLAVVGFIAAFVAVDIDVREAPGAVGVGAVAIAIVLAATVAAGWGVHELRGAAAPSRSIWAFTIVAMAIDGLALPFALNALFVEPPAAALAGAAVASVLSALIASIVVTRMAGMGGWLEHLFDGSSLVTLVFFTLVLVGLTLAAPAIPGAPLRLTFSISEAAEDHEGEGDDGGEGGGGGDDGGTTTVPCDHHAGDGVADRAAAEAMRIASAEAADIDFGCLEVAVSTGPGSWTQSFAAGAAVLIGSARGAAVVDGIWRVAFEDAGGGSMTPAALGGQILNSFDCGGTAAEIQPVVGDGALVVFMASRPEKYDDTGQIAQVHITPSTLMAAVARATDDGSALVAVGPVRPLGDTVEQDFVDPSDTGQTTVTLTAPATVGVSDPSLVPAEMTVERLEAACGV